MIVGILGGGQLGQMMVQAGTALGVNFRVETALDDKLALDAFAQGLDVATYEWENLPIESARVVAAEVPTFYPPLAALEIAQDRLSQKNFLMRLGVATSPFAPVSSEAELVAAVKVIGLPAVLKTRRMGYDGKGQKILRLPSDVEGAWQELGGVPLILEAFVPFRREVSLVSVRARGGAISCYDMAENEHREGILRVSIAPAPALAESMQRHAEGVARLVLEAFDYVGVLTLEFFEIDGRLLVNEVATRVHNSGHWTMDGAETSQFENHVRAITGKPLGPTCLCRPTVMFNLIGKMPALELIAAVAGAKLYDYGKSPRAGRKLGHINAPLAQLEQLRLLLG